MTQMIVVANGAKAAFYELDADEKAQLRLDAQFDHALGRAKGAELESDRAGALRGHGSDSARYQPRVDVRRNELEHFGRQLADELDLRRRSGRFTQLTLVASNPFLGVLRAQLAQGTRDTVCDVIPHDYTQLDARALRVKLDAARGAGH